MRQVQRYRLGRVEYDDGRELQRRFREARTADRCPDTLLWVEHPPIVTRGRSAGLANLRWTPERMRQVGIEIHESERGGDVTYHGPGQLVGYPILQLAPDRKDVRRYVRDLEETVIRALWDFGISAHRESRWPGVWVGKAEDNSLAKIAALGVHLSRWVTMHGFALNVSPDLSHFESIVPCGIQDGKVTSMAQILGDRVPSMAEVEARLEHAFCEVFDAELIEPAPLRRTVAVYVTRRSPSGFELLLLRRRPERGGFWQPVTGKVDEGESDQAAADRELQEETGLQEPTVSLDYRHAFARGEEVPPSLIEESAFTLVWNGQPIRLSDEHDAADWVSLPQALERLPFAGLREGAKRAGAV